MHSEEEEKKDEIIQKGAKYSAPHLYKIRIPNEEEGKTGPGNTMMNTIINTEQNEFI